MLLHTPTTAGVCRAADSLFNEELRGPLIFAMLSQSGENSFGKAPPVSHESGCDSPKQRHSQPQAKALKYTQ